MTDLLIVFLAAIIFVLLWTALVFDAIFLIGFICKLFGRTPAPPQVPNKAVWG